MKFCLKILTYKRHKIKKRLNKIRVKSKLYLYFFKNFLKISFNFVQENNVYIFYLIIVENKFFEKISIDFIKKNYCKQYLKIQLTILLYENTIINLFIK